MKMDTCLLNRAETAAASDGSLWMHVCPLGDHPWISADGTERIIQVIDREACEAMARTYPIDGPSARIDIDHKSMDPQNTTEASGWGKFAELRDDGLWVKAEPTLYGRPLINGKVYQFTSPCFPRSGLVDLGSGRFRVTKLGVIALTNDPNLRGQKPLTNRRAQSANPNTKTTSTMDLKAMLFSLLGLPADASDEAVTAAISAAKNATKPDALNTRIAELQTQLANTDLDAHGITDATQRAMFTPLLTNTTSRPAALATLQQLKAKPAAAPIHNRQGAPVPKTDQDLSQGDADPEKEARLFQGEVLDYKNSKGCTYEAAHQAITNKRRAAGA